jgi:hypothetical protein
MEIKMEINKLLEDEKLIEDEFDILNLYQGRRKRKFPNNCPGQEKQVNKFATI